MGKKCFLSMITNCPLKFLQTSAVKSVLTNVLSVNIDLSTWAEKESQFLSTTCSVMSVPTVLLDRDTVVCRLSVACLMAMVSASTAAGNSRTSVIACAFLALVIIKYKRPQGFGRY